MALVHDLMLYLLCASLAIAAFLAIERGIFYLATRKELALLMAALHERVALPALRAGGVAGALVAAFRSGTASHSKEDAMDKAFIVSQRQLQRHLWLMDTIVTAAPLLGLLGTVLGILDTFTTLAQSGISDPQGVSAGIGTALVATAVGIGTALVCLVVHNAFVDKVEALGDEVKLALIELSAGA